MDNFRTMEEDALDHEKIDSAVKHLVADVEDSFTLSEGGHI